MSKEEENKAVVARWFTEFWGKNCNLSVVDDIAAPDMLLKYSLHEPRRGHDEIKAFMTDFREAFPDLAFSGTADLLAEGRTDEQVVTALYQRALARKPTEDEQATCRRYIEKVGDRKEALEDILWALVNSTEFLIKK